MVFSDAMKCGCPVICMPVGDLPRLIEEYQVGVLAVNISARDFADAIRVILQDNPKNYKDELNIVKSVFTLDLIVQKFLQNIT